MMESAQPTIYLKINLTPPCAFFFFNFFNCFNFILFLNFT